jgi:adenylosuccinate lyase
MLQRYTLEPMRSHWGDQSTKFSFWLMVEFAWLKARREAGDLSAVAHDAIRREASFSVSRIEEFEAEYGHDMIAFVKAVQTSLGEAGVGEYSVEFHKFLTSYDTEDPAMVLMLRQALEWVLLELEKFALALLNKAEQHKTTLMIMRSHGQFAEPSTFGHLLLVSYHETRRNISRLRGVLDNELGEGKMSGACGSYAGISPALEAAALAELGLRPAKAETQILQRDRHATVINALSVTAGSIERMARTFWEMMRSEVRELEEPRSKRQRGSSAMAHKKNPILTEQLMGLPRLLRGYAVAAMENIATPEARDISQSSVERHVFPDATSLVHYMARKATGLVEGLVVFPERMLYNLNVASRGVWASQNVRNSLMEHGVEYDPAYEYLQEACFDTTLTLSESMDKKPISDNDPRTGLDILGRERLDACFNAWEYVRPGVEHMFAD